LMQSLQQALALEAKFQPRLQLPPATNSGGEGGEITSAMRDGAAHVLRCLKVWYDLPSTVLLALNLSTAVNWLKHTWMPALSPV